MDTPEEADKAISEMSGFELKGRAMTVNQATERPPRDRGGRDGGFRSGGGYQRRDNNRGYHQGTGVVVTEVSDPVEDTRGGTTTGVTSRGEVTETEDTRGGTTTGVTSRGEVTEMVVTEAGEVTETAATKEVATVVTITAEATDMVMTTGVRDKNATPKVVTGDATTTRRSQPLSQSDAAISPPSQ